MTTLPSLVPSRPEPVDTDRLLAALAVRDLSDPAAGAHAMQALLSAAVDALSAHWGCAVDLRRPSPLVAVEDNYDRLGFDHRNRLHSLQARDTGHDVHDPHGDEVGFCGAGRGRHRHQNSDRLAPLHPRGFFEERVLDVEVFDEHRLS